MAKTEI